MSFDLKIANGDISIASDGSMNLVFDNNKLKQDVIKMLLTKLGENHYHPSYGSKIGALDIGFVPDQELLEIDLQSSVTDSINKLISLQKSQSKRQFITPGERMIALQSVSVKRDTLDPRLYSIFLTIQTGQLTSITESLTVRVI